MEKRPASRGTKESSQRCTATVSEKSTPPESRSCGTKTVVIFATLVGKTSRTSEELQEDGLVTGCVGDVYAWR